MRSRNVPLRTCAACRAKRPKREFIRIVRAPDGEILVDPPRNVAGRGSYLCKDLNCWLDGVNGGGLAWALKGPVPDETGAALIAKARAEFAND